MAKCHRNDDNNMTRTLQVRAIFFSADLFWTLVKHFQNSCHDFFKDWKTDTESTDSPVSGFTLMWVKGRGKKLSTVCFGFFLFRLLEISIHLWCWKGKWWDSFARFVKDGHWNHSVSFLQHHTWTILSQWLNCHKKLLSAGIPCHCAASTLPPLNMNSWLN